MKKTLKSMLALGVCVVCLSGCYSHTTPITATSNPVGNKCGEATYKTYCWGLFGGKNADIGIDKAVKEAGIIKISHVDRNVKKYGFFGARKRYTTRVYGD